MSTILICKIEWMSNCCLMPSEQLFLAISCREQVEFYSASSVKQQSTGTGKHMVPLWHIILIPYIRKNCLWYCWYIMITKTSSFFFIKEFEEKIIWCDQNVPRRRKERKRESYKTCRNATEGGSTVTRFCGNFS